MARAALAKFHSAETYSRRQITAERALAHYKLHRAFTGEALQRALDGDYVATARRKLHRATLPPELDRVLDDMRGADGRRVAHGVSVAARCYFERLAMAVRRWTTPKRWQGTTRRGSRVRGGAAVSGFYLYRWEAAELAGVHANTIDRALAALAAVELVELWPIFEYVRGKVPPKRAGGRMLNWRRAGTLVTLGPAAWDAFGITQLRAPGQVRRATASPVSNGSHGLGSKGSTPDLSVPERSRSISARAREDLATNGEAWRVPLAFQLHRVATPSRKPKVPACAGAIVDQKKPEPQQGGGAAPPAPASKCTAVAPTRAVVAFSPAPAPATPPAPPAAESEVERAAILAACRAALTGEGGVLGRQRKPELGRRLLAELGELDRAPSSTSTRAAPSSPSSTSTRAAPSSTAPPSSPSSTGGELIGRAELAELARELAGKLGLRR